MLLYWREVESGNPVGPGEQASPAVPEPNAPSLSAAAASIEQVGGHLLSCPKLLQVSHAIVLSAGNLTQPAQRGRWASPAPRVRQPGPCPSLTCVSAGPARQTVPSRLASPLNMPPPARPPAAGPAPACRAAPPRPACPAPPRASANPPLPARVTAVHRDRAGSARPPGPPGTPSPPPAHRLGSRH